MTGGKTRKTTTAQERLRRTEKDFDKTIKNKTKRERTRLNEQQRESYNKKEQYKTINNETA